MSKVEQTKELKIPEHVAIIMDGNGRWAKAKGKSRTYGHQAGGETLREIVYAAADFGIKYLTVYAFSTENWSRPREEILGIKRTFLNFFNEYYEEFIAQNCRVRFMGRRTGLSPEVLERIQYAEENSATKDGLQVIIAFNYGARQEIFDAVKAYTKDLEATGGQLELASPADFYRYFYLPDVPDPDLIIRSSGEQRLSNFLLWQAAYSEFWTSNILWPDFTKDDLWQAIVDFNQRQRRYGGL